MRDQPVLTDAEWDLIAELLQVELEELPGEIHHAGSLEAREELRERRRMVQDLLQRLRLPASAGR
jgi:hypothetical protein